MASWLSIRSLTGLSAYDETGREVLRGYKQGDLIRVKTTRVRNPGHHRLFFALLNLVFENQERYASVEHLLTALKVQLGHCDTIILGDGEVVYCPKSISFSKMDQDEFATFYDKAVDVICQHFLPGVKFEDLKREVLEIVDPQGQRHG